MFRYAGGLDCSLTISATGTNEVTLSFSRMHLASSGDCLEVYDGATADPNQRAAKWCGTMPYSSAGRQLNPVPGELVLHSGSAHLVWTTYRTASNGKGWSASWEFTGKSPGGATPICGGGGTAALTSGTGTLVDTLPDSTGALYYQGMSCRRARQ